MCFVLKRFIVFFTAGCPTQGNLRITVTGQHFAKPLQITVGNAPCTSIGNTTNANTTFSCVLPAGTGLNQPITVVANGQRSALAQLLSYAAPLITSITSSVGGCSATASLLVLNNCPRDGSATLTINGANFGPAGASVFVGTSQSTTVKHDNTNPNGKLTASLPPAVSGVNNLNDLVRVVQLNGEASNTACLLSYAGCGAGSYDGGAQGCLPCANGACCVVFVP